MSAGIFSIGNSALSAAYTALRTAGNNVANANTPGYTRQSVVMVPAVGSFTGGSFIGQGVAIADVRRDYSEFLTSQAHQGASVSAQADMRATQLGQLAALFDNPSTGIGWAIDNFFAAAQDLSQRPADTAARQQMISAGSLLSQRFNDIGARLQEMRNGADRQVRLETDTINRAAQEIAQLNDKIALARGTGATPNDLLDRRDAAIRKLNESVRVSEIEQDDGAVNLFLGNGQPLVIGSKANAVSVRSDPRDPQQLQVGVTSGGFFLAVEPDRLGGGRVAGLMQFRAQDLPAVENELGRLALALSSEFNAQHRLGNDSTGAAGGDFFAPLALSALAAPGNGNPATSASVTLADATQLQISDYRIDYNGSQYVLTRLADDQQWTSAVPSFAQDGLDFSLANTPPAVGDSFTIRPFAGASRDLTLAITLPRQIAAANPVQVTVPAANVGALVVDGIAVQGLARNPNLANPVSVVFTSASAYEIRSGATVLTSGSYTPGAPIDYNGWRLTVRGTPAANDTLNVGANAGGIGDNRNALRLADVADRLLIDGASVTGGFSGLVSRLGGATQGATVFATVQSAIYESAVAAESASAGVNLDEEAMRLIQYQQQYQAASKLITIGRTLFDEILALGR
ncbi:MAG: flagellar hook-associated protein FlgK [Burkholderiaceae bacterium]|nr:flagellar hook-associated protein FlgK [Burkholderiaceae bacterium]